MFDKEFNVVAALILLLVGVVIALAVLLDNFDNSIVTPHVELFTIVDKWHEEECSPMQDANGNYIGESCEDLWTLAIADRKLDNLDFGSQRFEKAVQGRFFKEFKVGDRVLHQYDLGRLGLSHNEVYQKFEVSYASSD